MNKKNKKSIYIFELILFIFIGIFKIIFLNKFPSYANIVNIIFWIIFSGILFIFYGYFRNKDYLRRSAIRIVIVMTLFYLVLSYLLGFFLGFMPNPNFNNIFDSLKNVFEQVILYFFMQLARYIIFKKNPNKKQIAILTLEYIVLNILIGINGRYLGDYKSIFIVTATIILPIIATQCLYSYIIYTIHYVPSLIYELVINLYVYFVPFLPLLGNYITAVIELIIPFLTFVEIYKALKYKEKYSIKGKKTLRNAIIIITILFLSVLVCLTSGIFKHELVAIVSGSMSPVYERGDAVLITKKDASEIKEGEVLAFNVGTGITTHRVMSITYSNGIYTFVTKGDANRVNDSYEIHNQHVIGTVDYILKYAGYPTVWINEIFEGR